jgi:hypothetical protein
MKASKNILTNLFKKTSLRHVNGIMLSFKEDCIYNESFDEVFQLYSETEVETENGFTTVKIGKNSYVFEVKI